jgi:branched-chain amino acid transport system permease protein
VVVLALAAMALNFLLGFTGVHEFGHAAYFGLGAYGTGLTLKYLVRQHAAGDAAGILLGGIAGGAAGPADRAAPRRLFRHGDDRLRPGLLLHRLSAGTASPAATTGCAASPASRWISGRSPSTSCNNGTLFYYFVLFVFAVCVAADGFLLRSPFGRT